MWAAFGTLYLEGCGCMAPGNFENAYSRRCIFLDFGGKKGHSGQTSIR